MTYHTYDPITNQQSCSKCHVLKDRDADFYKYNSGRHYTYCKLCINKNNCQKALLRRYKLTTQQHENMIAQQNNQCAICQVPQVETMHVDHDHKTNKVRKLLCPKCNKMLGMANDNVKILCNAIWYLLEH